MFDDNNDGEIAKNEAFLATKTIMSKAGGFMGGDDRVGAACPPDVMETKLEFTPPDDISEEKLKSLPPPGKNVGKEESVEGDGEGFLL